MTQTFPAADERYEILAELGSGGMGIVYKARERETGDIVALKILHPAVAGRADQIDRLRTELRLARKITHKNVCRVYDINRLGQVAAISMEYIEGESLRALMDRRRRLPLPEAFDIIRQVMAGLTEAHAQGVVHRDLKPENILVSGDGTVKVMDFGLARNTDGLATTTAAGLVLGSPAYMSPEQVEGKTADARSDIYAFGMVIYEIFCGRRAFAGDTPIALAMKQVHEPPPSPRVFAPDLPGHVEAAVLRCLEKDPSQRFQNVSAVARALETEAAGHAPEGRAWLPRGPAARNALYATTALVIVSAGTLWYARGGQRGAPAPPQKRETAALIALAQTQVTTAAATGEKTSIATLAFQSVQNQPEFAGLTLGIADAFAGSFARSGRFRIVERTQLDQALKELDLNRTDRIDPATAQRVGQLIGAQYLVVGSFQVVGGQIRIDARLLRVETGEVVQADSITGATASALVMPDRLAERLLSQIR